MTIKSHVSWLTLTGAIAAWIACGIFLWIMSAAESTHAAHLADIQNAASQKVSGTKLHALAAESAAERAQLDAFLQVDVVSVVNTIESIGKSTGTKVQVNDVKPEAVPGQSNTATPISAVGFLVNTQGSFSQVMQVVRLLQTLPLPSSIEEFDMGTGSSIPGGASAWTMNARVRVLTTSPLSS